MRCPVRFRNLLSSRIRCGGVILIIRRSISAGWEAARIDLRFALVNAIALSGH